MENLDLTDRKILAELQAHGRTSNTDLSRRVGLSESPCLRRVRNLENDGVIAGYSALLDHRKLGLEIVAYVQVNLDQRSEADTNAFVKAVKKSAVDRRMCRDLRDARLPAKNRSEKHRSLW